MESYKWCLTIALCFSALPALQAQPTLVIQNDAEPTAPVTVNADRQPPFVTVNARQPPPVTLNANDDDDESDVTGDDEREMKLPLRDFIDTNPTEVKGEPVFEGDILLTQDQWRAIRERKGIANEVYRWPKGTDGNVLIPYVFVHDTLNQTAIFGGMNDWEQNTCIRFQQTTNTAQPHLRFIYGGGCYSYIGMIWYWNGQDISIGPGCDSVGIVAHEIGHAAGFYHEQSRPERDDYVVINWINIEDSKEPNFEKATTTEVNNQNTIYDYSSVMHYGSTGFTINGKTTIATIDRLAQALIGQREGLSFWDIRLANIMYNCTGKWLDDCSISTDTCQNGGYIGDNCACVCPTGTTGTHCETQTGSYYEPLQNSCTQNVTTEGTLSSPNHPQNYPRGNCIKWIQAPECHVPMLTFTAFRLYGKNNYCFENLCCYFDALEIRTDNLDNGEVYCGTDIADGTSFTSPTQEMVLFFRTRTDFYTGWSADLTFKPQEGCVPTGTTTTTTTPTTTTTTTPTTTTTTPTTTTTTTPTTTTTTPTTTTTTTPTTTTTTPTTTTTTTTTPTTTTTTPTTTTTTTPTTTTTTPTTTTTTPTTTTTTPTTTTTTTTPTTTTTTTPTTTTTTTTTPTTTTTTSTTTTATTTLTTSTTTPTTTTTEETSPSCLLEYYNGAYYWSSPNFGVTDYPNSFTCSLYGSATPGYYSFHMELDTFILQGKRRRRCRDNVRLEMVGDKTKTLCGSRSGKVFTSPSFNFQMNFTTDETITAPGFNISIRFIRTDCHQVITHAAAGETGTITASREQRSCEYRIVAPAGSQVRIDSIDAKIATSRQCRRDRLLVNGNSERMYPLDTSSNICGYTTVTTSITSNTGEMYLAYEKSRRRTRGFTADYTII